MFLGCVCGGVGEVGFAIVFFISLALASIGKRIMNIKRGIHGKKDCDCKCHNEAPKTKDS